MPFLSPSCRSRPTPPPGKIPFPNPARKCKLQSKSTDKCQNFQRFTLSAFGTLVALIWDTKQIRRAACLRTREPVRSGDMRLHSRATGLLLQICRHRNPSLEHSPGNDRAPGEVHWTANFFAIVILSHAADRSRQHLSSAEQPPRKVRIPHSTIPGPTADHCPVQLKPNHQSTN
jgi:hypothetical protein